MLKEQIEKDLVEAMKARNEKRLSVLRMLKTAVQNAVIEKRGKVKDVGADLTEEEVLVVIKKMVKQTRDSALEFEKGGRQDLADKNKEEIAELEKYLPAEMPQEELEKIVRETIVEMQAGKTDFGKVMGAVMKKVAGRADGNRIKELAEKLLV